MKECKINFSGKYNSLIMMDGADYDIGHKVMSSEFFSLFAAAGSKLTIGDNVFFNDHCSLRCRKEITIGKNTLFGDGVRLYDHDHDYSNYHVERISFTSKPIHIGSNCWICANCVILKGVTIGDNVIVGAGCVIHSDIPANTIVYNDNGIIKQKQREQKNKHCLVFTLSDKIKNLEYLLESLPNVDFHIAAPCTASDYLKSFKKHKNFQLYTNINQDDINDLIDLCDIYLDINCYNECCDAIKLAKEQNKPILAFASVAHKPEDATVFADDEVHKMIHAINEIFINIGK